MTYLNCTTFITRPIGSNLFSYSRAPHMKGEIWVQILN